MDSNGAASSDEHSSEMDDTSFLRTDDVIYLSSVLPGTSTRICLSAEEFGQRSCFLQDCQNKDVPMEMTFSSFIIEEALSVRALQEIVGQKNANEETQAMGGSHRTLLYGHAILLRHQASEMLLACLSSSSGTDKLAFDVGLQETVQGESCWWTVHPASKQRSEGEKVRVGDDLILVSVASERYLHVNSNRSVDASFHQTLWTVIPICSGLSRMKNVGVVFGSDVVRFFHGHMEECLTVSAVETDGQSQYKLMFEGEAAAQHARSLWCLEHIRNRWAGACFSWNSKCRIRHVTTGRYLAVNASNEIALVPRNRADQPVCAFHLRKTKDAKQLAEIPPDEDEEEGVDSPDIKYGDTVIYPQFAANGHWLSYKAYETTKIGVGRVEEKQAVVLPEGRMDDGLTMTRAPDEDSKAARVIRKCTSLFSRFIRGLDALQTDGSDSVHWKRVNLDDIFRCLLDLIAFFSEPDENEEHEIKMKKTRALRNRQNLFQEEGMLALMLDANDKLSGFSSQQLVTERQNQEGLTQRFDELQNQLYLLIAAMIKGNRANCALFAEKPRLDWLFSRLSNQQSSSKGVLEVLHYILIESPEVLNMIRVEHIQAIMSLIDKHGRDAKILQVLSALCIASNDKMAVRNNQNVICEHLQANKSVLLETSLTDQVASVRPNLFVGQMDDCAYYRKWYYEVMVDHVEPAGNVDAVLRVGWACTNAFTAVIGSGDRLGAQAVGEDLSSFAFDGEHIWTGNVSRRVALLTRPIQRGDTIGCYLDLATPEVRFTWNGARVNGCIRELSIYGMVHPVVTLSSKIGFRFIFGGSHGKFMYAPSDDFAPMYEALMPNEQLSIEQCFSFGDVPKSVFSGPTAFDGVHMFVPRPVITKHIQLPLYLEPIRDHLAENLHEMWASSKIEQGWSFGDERDDAKKKHPYLTSFEKLPKNEKQYNLALAFETLRIILALDYRVIVNPQIKSSFAGSGHRLKTVRMPNSYLQLNGYRPAPLDLNSVQLSEHHKELVNLLAENTHNVWCADRIAQGWTFGVQDDPIRKRSPLLLPFSKVDPYIRKINVETAANTIKTLLVHGCLIDLSSTDHADDHGGKSGKQQAPGADAITTDLVTPLAALPRSFRAQANYAVTAGRWYYEVTILTAGYVRIGWAHVDWDAQCELGSDEHSYAFDGAGMHAIKVHNRAAERFGKRWQVGAIIGCMLNLNDRTISFALNGEVLMDQSGQEVAFRSLDVSHPFVPAISLKPGQKIKANFGQDVETLKYFSSSALQEGYEPYCVNMTRPMPFCYSNSVAEFRSIETTRSRIDSQKSATSSHAPPKLLIQSNSYGRVEKPEMETVRLGLPIVCSPRLAAAHAMLENPGGSSGKSSKEERRRSISQSGMVPKRASMSQSQPVAETGGPVARKIAQKFTDLKESLDERIPKRSVGRSPFNLFRTRSPSPGQVAAGTATSTPRSAKTGEGKAERKSSSKKESKSRLANMMAGGTQDDGEADANARKASHAAIGLPLSVFEGVARQFEQKMGGVNEHRPALVLFFLVRVLPGQDLDSIHVGWVTAGFHGYMHKSSQPQSVSPLNIRRASLLQFDYDGQSVVDGLHLRDCYMLPAKEVFSKYGVSEDASKRVSQGLLFSCFVDVANGHLTFEMNGRRLPIDFRVPFDVPLYPAVTCVPSARDMFEFVFEFPDGAVPSNPTGQPLAPGQRVGVYPLTMAVAIDRMVTASVTGSPSAASRTTSGTLAGHRSQRIEVQALCPAYWSRVPNAQIRPHIMKLSDTRGWSIICEDPVSMMKVCIAQDSRSIDILELNEQRDLETYFANMLDLYKAVCYQGNASATLLIRGWIDERQILYACENQYLPGSLRVRFYDLLITLYLESAATARLLMQSEYIMPIEPHVDPNQGPARSFKRVDAYLRFHAVPPASLDFALPPVELTGSNVQIAGGKRVDFIHEIKKYCLSALGEISSKHLDTLRDPVGESHANCIVPLLKVVDRFLVMDALDKVELCRLLAILDSTLTQTHGALTAACEVHTCTSLEHQHSCNKATSLLDMDLDNSIKLELCHIFHHLVDIQVRNRVREVIGFAEEYTNFVQRDQLRRYVTIKQADLPPSVTAKKTREFRCPPKEQMRTLLSAVKKDEMAEEMTIENFYDWLLIYHTNLVVSCDFSTNLELCAKEDEAIATALSPVVTDDGTPLMEKVIVGFANKCRERVRKWRARNEPPPQPVTMDNFLTGNTLSQVIVKAIMKWTRNEHLKNNELIREIFSLLYRQYGSLEELMNALDKTYVISSINQRDVNSLVKNLSVLRALIDVQLEPAEEELLKSCMWKIMDNTIFFQHPDLIRTLSIHETVMQLMVKTLKKTQQQQTSEDAAAADATTPTADGAQAAGAAAGKSATEMSVTMVVMCCRFLCYFCRSSRLNQKAMFDHLSYMLDNCEMLLDRPSQRGQCPIDVGYFSFMDNTELTLALRESHLEKIVQRLARCGVQSNPAILTKGYPDIGWDPIVGERFLDFLKFTVWVNGESVEENANLVVRLLIRKPECLGPALRGSQPMGEDEGSSRNEEGGGGLMKAIQDGIMLSVQVAIEHESYSLKMPPLPYADHSSTAYDDDDPQMRNVLLAVPKCAYDLSRIPPADDEDYVNMGSSILAFYSVLVDLLGRCAAEASRSDTMRIRAILRSLVSMEDLQQVLSLRFLLPTPQYAESPAAVAERLAAARNFAEQFTSAFGSSQQDVAHGKEDGGSGAGDEEAGGDLPGLQPEHKAAMVNFLERVYGIDDRQTFTQLLESSFLSDLRTANLLDSAGLAECDMALALNRYLFGSILPLLTKLADYFAIPDAAATDGGSAASSQALEDVVALYEATLHTVYRLSQCKSLTKGQCDAIADFLIAFTKQLRPQTMRKLLRKVVNDVASMSNQTSVALMVLTNLYERCANYYGHKHGHAGGHATASEEERRLTVVLFTGLFDALAQKPADPELFQKALSCLIAIGCAISPDYVMRNAETKPGQLDSSQQQQQSPTEEQQQKHKSKQSADTKIELPRYFGDCRVSLDDLDNIQLSITLQNFGIRFAAHFHDLWVADMLTEGWEINRTYSERDKRHPNLLAFSDLPEANQRTMAQFAVRMIQAILVCGYDIESVEQSTGGHASRSSEQQRSVRVVPCRDGYPGHVPKNLLDLRNIVLSKDLLRLSDMLSEKAHEIWLSDKLNRVENEGDGLSLRIVPFDQLTAAETRKEKRFASELLKYFHENGYRIVRQPDNVESETDSGVVDVTAIERRFAYRLLERLLEYADKAIINLKQFKPSERCSEHRDFVGVTTDVKFFMKAVLPFIERYFRAHSAYFANPTGSQFAASQKEKEIVAILFCKLATLLRQKMTSFGHDLAIGVRCLQTLIQATDIRAVAKNNADFVRANFLPFFNNAASDLMHIYHFVSAKRLARVRGTTQKAPHSIAYMNMVLVPACTATFEHLARTGTGEDLLVGEVQFACYRILVALYKMGVVTSRDAYAESTLTELTKHRHSIGQCIAAFASCFPVAFLEPEFNQYNRFSLVFGIEPTDPEMNPNIKEVLQSVAQNIHGVREITATLQQAADMGGRYTEEPFILDVILPMFCSYLPVWWGRTSDTSPQVKLSNVMDETLNTTLGCVLKLIYANMGSESAEWMKYIAALSLPIVTASSASMLTGHFLPVAKKLSEVAKTVADAEGKYQQEKRYQQSGEGGTGVDLGEMEEELMGITSLFVRDLFAFYPLLIKYVDVNRGLWLRSPSAETQLVFQHCAEIFIIWSRSPLIKKEEHNFLTQSETDYAALLESSQTEVSAAGLGELAGGNSARSAAILLSSGGAGKSAKRERKKRDKRKTHDVSSLFVVSVKRTLPIGMSVLGGLEQELIQYAKERYIQEIDVAEETNWMEAALAKDNTDEMMAYLRPLLHSIRNDSANSQQGRWKTALYRKIGHSKLQNDASTKLTDDTILQHVVVVTRVLRALHVVEHPPDNVNSAWRKLMTSQRKRAVIACFRMVPLHNLPRHRVVNLFIRSYKDEWLAAEETTVAQLIEDITCSSSTTPAIQLAPGAAGADQLPAAAAAGGAAGAPAGAGAGDAAQPVGDPLKSLIESFIRTASAERKDESQIAVDPLFVKYAQIMSMSCTAAEEDEEEGEQEDGAEEGGAEGADASEGGEEGGEEDGGASIEEAELQKQRLLFEQGRLAQRGASEMVLQYIGICKGEQNEVLEETINLGISILQEGNQQVQQRMLDNLKEKKDVDFFTSIAGLIRNCSVLDLDAFERCNKADNLGVAAEGKTLITNLYDADFTCKLFRFLQLLCEGHNSGWQNYLRSQAGNSTTVNLVVATVDYLLRLQESISDFYWYYSSKPSVDVSGTENFCKAICIGKQVFNTLTEYIQGPCVGNQMTLAHSRLWDAVNGFLFVFAHMQDKLSRDASQLRLLREFMELQNEMMVLLLSMLEGNVLNGPIGRQMVDTLAESSANVEMILKFFEIFLKMKNCTTSEQFQQFDVNGDGIISPQEFRTAMEQMKLYTAEEIEYIMVCVDANADGKVDFNEFSERFHNPVKEIGLIVAILLTNLSEHMTHDVRLERILARAKSVLIYFEPYLGRIEIKGRNSRIERVYFEVKQSYIDQWEKPQIKDSKRSFLHSVVSEGGEKEKLESFVNFCEDTIFEMEHAQEIGSDELQMRVFWNAGWHRISDSLKFQIFVWIWMLLCFVVRILAACANRERISNVYHTVRSLTPRQVIVGFVRLLVNSIKWSIRSSIRGSIAFVRAIWMIMRGDLEKPEVVVPVVHEVKSHHPPKKSSDNCVSYHADKTVVMDGLAGASEMLVDRHHQAGECSSPYHVHNGGANGDAHGHSHGAHEETEDMERVKRAKLERRAAAKQKKPEVQPQAQTDEEVAAAPAPEFDTAKFDLKRCMLSLFARSFYKMKLIALAVAFFINFLLLFYRVARISASDTERLARYGIVPDEIEAVSDDLLEADAEAEEVEIIGDNSTALEIVGGDEEEEEMVYERVIISDDTEYLDTLIRALAMLHSCFSLIALIAYYQLKVPLVIFKTEKDIARQLEFEGMWIAEQPESDNLKSHWNRMAVGTASFPAMYWDKFVKKKVREKYAEQYDDAELAHLLGMDETDQSADEIKFTLKKSRSAAFDEEPPQVGRIRRFIDYMKSVDWKYYFWKSGIILTDNSFLYLLWYFVMSLLGNWNHFFFAAHLLDVAVGFKTLRTILQSVTHNGKQLVLTVMLTSIVVYLYTVLAFNFFRKFYIQEEDGKKDYKCHDMGSCFIFHLHSGVRAGGGIGDEIESPDGDETETYRILFDITFFFFVIVILLAIIQGLIIDAFGELRDQIEQVREDMESKCFICGIDREFFNKVPHGFEKHVQNEHNFANYMFFLMHLINKPETEYTGQESYVWELYSQRDWDFFPVGDCFRKQYEDQLAG